MSYIHLDGDTTQVLAFGATEFAVGLRNPVPSGYTGVDGWEVLPAAGYTMVVLPGQPADVLIAIEALVAAESTADQASIYSCVVCYRSAFNSGNMDVAKQVIDDFTFPGGLATLKTNMQAAFPA